MTIEFMKDLLTRREKITVEYKECQNGIYNMNTSVRDLLAREIIGNILVHRDYSRDCIL